MSLLGDVFGFVGDSANLIASHPLQAAGAAFGVPGYDPAIGGLLNNQPGGALISPTGNFTSSAWQNMYQNDPGNAGGLNLFNSVNGVADKIAPAVAGGFATGALGGIGSAGSSAAAGAAGAGTGAAGEAGAGAADAGAGLGGAGMGTAATWGGASAAPVVGSGTSGLFSSGAGAGGLTGLLGGPAATGDAGLTGAVSAGGSGIGSLMGGVGSAGGDMGSALGSAPTGLFSGMLPGGGMSGTASGALGGGLSGGATGAGQLGDSTMGGLNLMPSNQSLMNQGQRFLQMSQQQQPQQRTPMAGVMPQQNRFGGQRPQGSMPLGPSMSYASFNPAGGAAPMNGTFGFGGMYG